MNLFRNSIRIAGMVKHNLTFSENCFPKSQANKMILFLRKMMII